MLKWHGKLSNIGWIWFLFVNPMKNGQKLGKLYLWKFMVFNLVFLNPKLSVFMKFHLILFHLWPKYFTSHSYPAPKRCSPHGYAPSLWTKKAWQAKHPIIFYICYNIVTKMASRAPSSSDFMALKNFALKEKIQIIPY